MNSDDNSLYVIVLKGQPGCTECMKNCMSVTKLNLSNNDESITESNEGGITKQDVKKYQPELKAAPGLQGNLKIRNQKSEVFEGKNTIIDRPAIPVNRKISGIKARESQHSPQKSLPIINVIQSDDLISTKSNHDEPGFQSEPSLTASEDEHDFQFNEDQSLSVLSRARMMSDSKAFKEDISSDEEDVAYVPKYSLTPQDELEIEQEEIEEGKFRITHPYSVAYLAVNFTVWLLLYSINAYYSFFDGYYDYDRGSAETFYKFTAAAFMASSLYCFYAYSIAQGRCKKRACLIMFMVNTAAFVTYLSMSFKLTYTFIDPFTDTPVDVVRFIEWAFLCPVTILISMQLCQGQKYLIPTIAADYSVYVFGLVGSMLEGPLRVQCLAAAYIAILIVFHQLASAYDDAIASRKPEIPRNNLRFLKWQTLLCWSMFGMNHFLFNLGLIDYEQAEGFYCMSDFVAKFLFSMVLVLSAGKAQKLH